MTRLMIVDKNGRYGEGFNLRAGDYVIKTEYDHRDKLLTAYIEDAPITLRVRFRRLYECLSR